MSGTWRVFHAEFVRLLRSRPAWAVALVLAGLSALRVLAAVSTGVMGQGGESPVSSGASWAPFVDGWRTGLTLGTLGLLVFAARSIAGDLETGVLRVALTRSVTRSALILGRLLLAPAQVVMVILCTGLASFLVASIYGDFGPLVEDGYELFSAQELRSELGRAVWAAVPPMIATYAFGLLVSCLARSATEAVVGSLGVFLAFDMFKESLGQAQYWVFAAFAPTLADGSAVGEMSGIARGFSDSGFSETLLRMNHIIPWPQALLSTLLACLVLSRRSL